MSGSTFFVKPCPACGRSAQILLNYLGKQVCCKHCGREFAASDPAALGVLRDDDGANILFLVKLL